jgi:hypothetical protein
VAAAAAATGNTITMASESICSVMTPDQTSSPPRIHHRRPSAHVLGAAVVYFDATHPNVVEIKQRNYVHLCSRLVLDYL